jgi:hypothetical protein
MKSTIVVTYTLKPEAMDEHLGFIDGVFAELAAAGRTDVAYEVLRLNDGVSFVHISTSDTADGSNPLPALASFKAFSAGLPDRVATKPAPTPADAIGSYRPA